MQYSQKGAQCFEGHLPHQLFKWDMYAARNPFKAILRAVIGTFYSLV